MELFLIYFLFQSLQLSDVVLQEAGSDESNDPDRPSKRDEVLHEHLQKPEVQRLLIRSKSKFRSSRKSIFQGYLSSKCSILA